MLLAMYLYLAYYLWEVSRANLCHQPMSEYLIKVEPGFLMDDILDHFHFYVFSWTCAFLSPQIGSWSNLSIGRIGTKNYMLWTSPRRKHHADFIQAESSGVFYVDFLNWWLQPFCIWHLLGALQGPPAPGNLLPPRYYNLVRRQNRHTK